MKTYGYCRVSTRRQNIERQIRNIKEKYPDAIIVQDKYTGRKFTRPGWNRLYNMVASGDTIVFDEVSRMSRNAEEGFQVYQELYNRGVSLVFLKETHINTEVYKSAGDKQISLQLNSGNGPIDKFGDAMIAAVNNLLLDLAREQIKRAFAKSENEVETLRQRTREGIETARLAGKHIGGFETRKLEVKKKEPAKEMIRKYSVDFDGTLEDKPCMDVVKLSRNTFYKYKKEIREEIEAEQAAEVKKQNAAFAKAAGSKATL